MQVNQIVSVNISRLTATVSQPGFGTALIAGPNATFSGGRLTGTYTQASDLLADGFLTSHPEYIMAQKYFGQPGGAPQKLKVGLCANPTGGVTMAQNLAAIQAQDDDWYCLVTVDAVAADVLSAAAWIEALPKIYCVRTSDATTLTNGTTDIAAQLQALKYNRTFVIYHGTDTEYASSAWAGEMLPFAPGSAGWAFKQMAGVTADALNATQINNLKSKNCNYYTTVGGVAMTFDGQVASGEWIDVIVGLDWLQSTMQTRVFGTMINQKKVSYTKQGINLLVSDVRAALRLGITQGVIADDPEFIVTSPDISTISPTDKQTRTLNGVKFTAYLAGGIQNIQIQGAVTY